eukprot:s4189_g5.t1
MRLSHTKAPDQPRKGVPSTAADYFVKMKMMSLVTQLPLFLTLARISERSGWWWSDYHGSWDSWSWRGWSTPKTSQPQVSSQGKYDVSVTASVEADKFLPDFVVAWMLLQRSGLDGTERGAIIANLKNQFTTTRVKDALRLAWPEKDLKKRDMARGPALLVEDEDDEALMNDMDMDQPNDMTQEEENEYGYLVKEVEEAYQSYQVARRTLREAREKQSLFKKSRQFFPEGLRTQPLQSAHLAFSAHGTNEPGATDAALHAMQNSKDQAAFSLQQILREGKAIIDGGATSSVASVEAMKQIMKLNQTQDGTRDITVEKTDPPHFRFGNNGRTQCLSTAKVSVPLGKTLGEMRIHVHEIEGQPVLMSVAALRSLGAVAGTPPKQGALSANHSPEAAHRDAQGLQDKGELKTYLELHCHVELSGHETLKSMQARAYEEVMKASTAVKNDKMEFGKHSAMEYQEVILKDPSYTDWCITTMMEAGRPTGHGQLAPEALCQVGHGGPEGLQESLQASECHRAQPHLLERDGVNLVLQPGELREESCQHRKEEEMFSESGTKNRTQALEDQIRDLRRQGKKGKTSNSPKESQ